MEGYGSRPVAGGIRMRLDSELEAAVVRLQRCDGDQDLVLEATVGFRDAVDQAAADPDGAQLSTELFGRLLQQALRVLASQIEQANRAQLHGDSERKRVHDASAEVLNAAAATLVEKLATSPAKGQSS